jgi:hypothetical protein
MPTIEIRITVPEGADIKVEQIDPGQAVPQELRLRPPSEPIATYWRTYLSDNARKVFRAAARIEEVEGPGFTFDDVAQSLSVTHDTVQSWHRTAGRTAKRWRADTNTQEPIRLEEVDYAWREDVAGMRTSYRLPVGIWQEIRELVIESA